MVLSAPPVVLSIGQAPGGVTTAATLTYTVTFSEPVVGVAASDFKVFTSGSASDSGLSVMPVSASVYTVTIKGISGDGQLGLNLATAGSIRNLSGNALQRNAASVPFEPALNFATGVNPSFVAVADLNNDGIPDLVVSNYENGTGMVGNTISVLLGNGDGTFKAQRTFIVGLDPSAVAIGDVNGDTIPDIVTSDVGSETVSVLQGNGDGTFQPQKVFPAYGAPEAIALVDLRGNGKNDIVFADQSGYVGVMLGNGNGTFQPDAFYYVGGSTYSL